MKRCDSNLCFEKHYKDGLCVGCFRRKHIAKTEPAPVLIADRSKGRCKVCGDDVYATDLCKRHNEQFRLKGNTEPRGSLVSRVMERHTARLFRSNVKLNLWGYARHAWLGDNRVTDSWGIG